MTAQHPKPENTDPLREMTDRPLPSDFNAAVVQVLEELLWAVDNLDKRLLRGDESIRSPYGVNPLLNRIGALRAMLKPSEDTLPRD